jgi:hypothetical protein
VSSTGLNNWSKPYIPGRETPQSLLRFVPHDEEEQGQPELKRTYGTPRSRRRKPRPSSRRAAFALLGRT